MEFMDCVMCYSLARILMSEIKKMLMILGLERSGNKGEVVERLMAFMMQPEDTGKKPPAVAKVCQPVLYRWWCE